MTIFGEKNWILNVFLISTSPSNSRCDIWSEILQNSSIKFYFSAKFAGCAKQKKSYNKNVFMLSEMGVALCAIVFYNYCGMNMNHLELKTRVLQSIMYSMCTNIFKYLLIISVLTQMPIFQGSPIGTESTFDIRLLSWSSVAISKFLFIWVCWRWLFCFSGTNHSGTGRKSV